MRRRAKDVLVEVLEPERGARSWRVMRTVDGVVEEDRYRRSARSARELAEAMRRTALNEGDQVEVRGAGRIGRPTDGDAPRRTCSVKLDTGTWDVIERHQVRSGFDNRSRALEDLVRRGSIGCCGCEG